MNPALASYLPHCSTLQDHILALFKATKSIELALPRWFPLLFIRRLVSVKLTLAPGATRFTYDPDGSAQDAAIVTDDLRLIYEPHQER